MYSGLRSAASGMVIVLQCRFFLPDLCTVCWHAETSKAPGPSLGPWLGWRDTLRAEGGKEYRGTKEVLRTLRKDELRTLRHGGG